MSLRTLFGLTGVACAALGLPPSPAGAPGTATRRWPCPSPQAPTRRQATGQRPSGHGFGPMDI